MAKKDDQEATTGDNLAPTPPDLRWCKSCEEYVIPRQPDRACSKCGRYIPGSLGFTKGVVNPDRVQVLRASYERDYGPFNTTLDVQRCASLAAVTERMERWEASSVGKIDSLHYKNLAERREALALALIASRDARPAASTALENLSVADMKARARHLMKVIEALDDDEPSPPPVASAPASTDPPVEESAEPERCEFCGRACVGRDSSLYEIYHFNDPAEVKKRDDRATAEMMTQVGKPLPPWFR